MPYQELRGRGDATGSDEIRARVLAARDRQAARGCSNAEIPTARAHDRLQRVARTIADLSGVASLEAKQIAQAVQYRSLDRSSWG